MLKEKLKKYMPDREKIINSKSMRIFGKILHNPNLWLLNRNSVSKAFAIGLFCAWIPVPFQMILAAGISIIFHANLALAALCVWITNPITLTPMFIFAYKVGAFILRVPPSKFTFSLSFQWFSSTFQEKWFPFIFGCFVCAILSAIIGVVSIRLFWRYFTIRSWNKRKKIRENRNLNLNSLNKRK